MHGLLTGQESRQQLYTMLTRGRHANHLYLQVVGDGDPHTLIRPDTISPRTPTETLLQILGRDETPVSASTVLRELNDPEARLFQAVQRYTDGLHVAAEQLVGPQTVAELDIADQYIPGLTTEPAWPTLRAHPLALAAEAGKHPLRHLLTAAFGRDLRTAGDMAAVLYWRLTALTPTDPGPLPWLPGIPETLRSHPGWGQYGGPPTASIPKIYDQPEELSSKCFRPCGNNASTGIRAWHQPVRRCEGRQATRRTHRTPSKGRQAARVPTTRTSSERAVRARPIAHLSRRIAALRT
jgi:hypothetical protein